MRQEYRRPRTSSVRWHTRQSSGWDLGGQVARWLSLKYKDGEKKIIVPPDVPIVTYVLSDKSELKPGARVFISAAKKLPDGTLHAPRVNFGKDGLRPPM